MPNDHLCEHEHTIYEVKENVEKMIKGLYGPLDKPNEGFVHSTRHDIQDIKSDVSSIKNKINEVTKDNKKMIWAVILLVITTVIKQFI